MKLQARGSSLANEWVNRAVDDLPESTAVTVFTCVHQAADHLLAILSTPDLHPEQSANCMRGYMRLTRIIDDMERSLDELKVKRAACRSRLLGSD